MKGRVARKVMNRNGSLYSTPHKWSTYDKALQIATRRHIRKANCYCTSCCEDTARRLGHII